MGIGIEDMVEAVGFEFWVVLGVSPGVLRALVTFPAASPTDMAPTITPTAPRRSPFGLVAVATSWELAVSVVAGMDLLVRKSHAPPVSESSRFR